MKNENPRTKTREELRRMQIERNQGAIRLLDSWDQDQDEAKQVQDLADLKRSLDENRPGPRKLFP